MQTIWHRKNICCERHPQTLSLKLPREILYLCAFVSSFYFLLFKATGDGLCPDNGAITACQISNPTHPQRRQDASKRPQPSCWEWVATLTLLSALSRSPGGTLGLGLRKRAACSWQWVWSRVMGRGLGGGDGAQVIDRTGTGCCLLELLFEAESEGWGWRAVTSEVTCFKINIKVAELHHERFAEKCLRVTLTYNPSSVVAGGHAGCLQNCTLIRKSRSRSKHLIRNDKADIISLFLLKPVSWHLSLIFMCFEKVCQIVDDLSPVLYLIILMSYRSLLKSALKAKSHNMLFYPTVISLLNFWSTYFNQTTYISLHWFWWWLADF